MSHTEAINQDLDGDEYTLIQVPELFPPRTVTPAAYEPAVLNHLPSGGMCNLDTNHEVADFVTDFIINDILGVIAIRVSFTAYYHPNC